MAENPQYLAMYNLMQQMKANRENSTESEPGEARELAAYKARLAKASARIKQLTLEVEEMRESLSNSDRLEEDLANALGACVFCWGEDPTCRGCRGKGKPGAFEPDHALFTQFVLPALRRKRAGVKSN